ncbi:MAG: hypothetical protein ACJ72Z_01760 [Pyrinomonadaceae bacterium]
MREEAKGIMKFLMKLLFTFVAVVGLSLSVSAQKDDKRRPPKQDPPKINPKDKPPRDNPKGNDKRKRPGMDFVLVTENKEPESN